MMITVRFRLWASCWILIGATLLLSACAAGMHKAELVTAVVMGDIGKKIRNSFHVDGNNVVNVSIYFVTSLPAIMHDVLRRGTSP
jgi:hypothetical protein